MKWLSQRSIKGLWVDIWWMLFMLWQIITSKTMWLRSLDYVSIRRMADGCRHLFYCLASQAVTVLFITWSSTVLRQRTNLTAVLLALGHVQCTITLLWAGYASIGPFLNNQSRHFTCEDNCHHRQYGYRPPVETIAAAPYGRKFFRLNSFDTPPVCRRWSAAGRLGWKGAG